MTVTADEYLADEDDDNVLTPNPVEILGFEQYEYEVTPFQYFGDNSQFLVDVLYALYCRILRKVSSSVQDMTDILFL